MDIIAAMDVLPTFHLWPQPNGQVLVCLSTGEKIGKYEICGREAHILLKLSGGTAAVNPSLAEFVGSIPQLESYTPEIANPYGIFRDVFKHTAKCRFYKCDCYVAAQPLVFAAGKPHNHGCTCGHPQFGKWHSGYIDDEPP
jgi:hypothetical protein